MSKKDKKEDIETEEIIQEQSEIVEEQSVEERLQEELKQEKDKFLRLFAEFENYKKRTSKERIDLFRSANREVMEALLPILDDFDRAYAEISKTDEKDLLKGVELIRNKLKSTLQQKGLSVIEVAQGDNLNADNHEAVKQIHTPSEDIKGNN